MISLTDNQLKTVIAVAAAIEPDRLDVYLRRIAAMLRVRRRFDDSELMKSQGWQRAAWCTAPTQRDNVCAAS